MPDILGGGGYSYLDGALWSPWPVEVEVPRDSPLRLIMNFSLVILLLPFALLDQIFVL
jgi:hypothetical protein